MHWFGKEGASPSQAATAVVRLVGRWLGTFDRCADAREVEGLLSQLGASPIGLQEAGRLLYALQAKKFRLPEPKALARRPLGFKFALRALECACAAIREDTEGNEVEAWKLVASASLSCGQGQVVAIESAKAAKGAQALHREDHASKNDVFKWLDEHAQEHASKAAMARAIVAAKLVPMKERTIGNWVTEWGKQQAAT